MQFGGGQSFLILLVLVFTAALLLMEAIYLLWQGWRGPQALRLKQRQWAVIGEGGVGLRRGRELPQVLRVFDSRRFTVVE